MRLGTDWDAMAEGRTHALRQMPKHWTLHDPDTMIMAARSIVWLTARTVAVVFILALLYANAYAQSPYGNWGQFDVAPFAHKPPPVVTPPVQSPPVATPPSQPTTPAEQPGGYMGGGGDPVGPWVFAGVGIYFGAVIRSHWLFCAEDDRKRREERVCYRPLRDGMP